MLTFVLTYTFVLIAFLALMRIAVLTIMDDRDPKDRKFPLTLKGFFKF